MLFFHAFVREMRVHQWTKNVLVFAALLFSGELFAWRAAAFATEMFFSFSLVASGVYFLNDIFDYEKDRADPKKRHRPIASGALSRTTGAVGAVVLLSMGLVLAWRVQPACFMLVLSYVLVNIAYTVRLKHVVILDVMIIAYGFVVRAIVGAVAISVAMTAWFLLCVMFLSLFLALGKRRHELFSLKENKLAEGRKVLAFYSLGFIDQLMTIVTAAVLMCYSLFTMDPATENGRVMALTIPLAIYAMFYYLYVVRVKHEGGAPDEALYRERPILAVVLLYMIAIIVIRNL